MISLKTSVAIVFVAGIGLSACEEGDGTYNQTQTGTLIGAGVGAALGNLIGEDRESTAVGAIIGAGVGAAIGGDLERQEDALRASIGNSGARIVNTGDRLIVVMPEGITFDVDSANVRPSIQDEILAIARNLQDFPNNTVQVVGHTDNTGSDAYNLDLSNRRAGAVANLLRAGGVPGGRIVSYGRGESNPIASNNTASGRQANRRVEIIITPNT